jgi:hypothetical protein
MELSHLLLLSRFISSVGDIFNKRFTQMHEIFEGDEKIDNKMTNDHKKIKLQ